MVELKLISVEEFNRVRNASIDKYKKLKIITDMCRANTLVEVKRAGSGHLGSSFSAMDIAVWMYYEEMNTLRVGFDSPDRDVYFSSKGHDVPGLYAVLHSLGEIPDEKLLALRRLGGLNGHPDVGNHGIEANSGSLGMGISKGRGIAWAKKYNNYGGRVYVMIGDGELQEGQNYEALQVTAHHKIDNLTVIVDNNKVQSDKPVSEIIDLRNLEEKFNSFGWYVIRIDGHDFRQLEKAIAEAKQIQSRPQIIIADTIKGQGVSFMEHPVALEIGKGLYPWHSGAPDDASFEEGYQELITRINLDLESVSLSPIILQTIEPEAKAPVASMLEGEPLSQAALERLSVKPTDEYVSKVYGEVLVELASKRKDIVVLDADLSSDCKVREFENTYPERFIENGIAEQDMVSMAAGLARHGFLPVVNSFASFLASRANEQIYNATSEKSKIIYALHYAGLIPAGPGKSHQSLRDISLFSALPNCIIVQPCNAEETRVLMDYCVNQTDENSAIRLIIGPSPRRIKFSKDYQMKKGQGTILTEGNDAVMFAYGPVMLHEALLASELLAERGFNLKVINMPWLNRVDVKWLTETIKPYSNVFIVEDHHPAGGLMDNLLTACAEHGLLNNKQMVKFAVEGFPACGTPQQALAYHELDGLSLSKRVMKYCG